MKMIVSNFKKPVITIMFLLFLSVYSHAQNYAFRVMASSGYCQSSNTGKRLWAGTRLNQDDYIKIPSGAYLGLVHKNGRTLELKKPGTYSVKTLEQKLTGRRTSTVTRYVNYMVGEMTKADREDINKNHRKYMAITGSVERSSDLTREVLPLSVQLISKTSMDIYDPNALIKWATIEGEALTYVVNVYDMTDKKVGSFETKEDFVYVNFANLDYKYDQSWIVQIKAKENENVESDRYSITLLQDESKIEAIKEATQTDEEVSALDKLIHASFFEKNGLLLDAAKCYEQAIEMQPGVDTFVIAYKEFLSKNKMGLSKNTEIEGEETLKEEWINENNSEE